MRPELQRRVQRYGWDKAAAHYEAYWKQSLLPAQAKLLEMADLQPGQRVLEVASGTGLVTLPAARAVGPTGEIVATDVSDEMVRATLAAARQEGLDNVVTERMGAEELLVEDASFDVVLCSLGLMYVPDAALALREMLRVLRPGGQAVVAARGQRSSCG
jgi:ubiquinone/menaquinone biosynthesis C-methylase UbiE